MSSVSTPVTAVPDESVEGAETIVITASASDGTAVGTAQTVTINDDDEAVLRLSAAPSSIPEASGEATVTVSVVGATLAMDRQFTLSFGGTASEGIDYGVGSTTLVLEAGLSSVSTPVTAVPDESVEGAETIVITASASDGTAVGTAQTVTINDDDEAVLRLSAAPSSIPEASGEATVTVSVVGATLAMDRQFTLSFGGTASEGIDYGVGSTTLVLEAGLSSVSTPVTAVPDESVEGAETIVITASASDGTAVGTAQTVTINDDDRARLDPSWLARFARTVADQVMDAIDERVAPSALKPTSSASAGFAVDIGRFAPGVFALGQPVVASASTFGPSVRDDSFASPTALSTHGAGAAVYRDLSTRKFLLGNSFQFTALNEEPRTGAQWTVWGRTAVSRFAGSEGGRSLDGDVITGLVGADVERGRLLTGVAVSHSLGEGTMDAVTPSQRPTDVEASLTSVFPYARYAVSDALSVWAALGYGQGEYTQFGNGNGGSTETGIAMKLGALGARHALVSAAETGWYNLTLKSDAFWVQMEAEPDAFVADAIVEATRLRLGLEGWREGRLPSGGVLARSIEVAVRHDGGDAEEGSGLEMGGRVRYADPARGFALEATGQGLLIHEDKNYQDWGVGVSFQYDPCVFCLPGFGPSVRISPSWGSVAPQAATPWSRWATADSVSDDSAGLLGGRLEAELSYGMAGLGGSTCSPRMRGCRLRIAMLEPCVSAAD